MLIFFFKVIFFVLLILGFHFLWETFSQREKKASIQGKEKYEEILDQIKQEKDSSKDSLFDFREIEQELRDFLLEYNPHGSDSTEIIN